jgi:hypothetical protein
MPCKIKLIIQEVARLENEAKDGMTYIDDPIVIESGTWAEEYQDVMETIIAMADTAVTKLVKQYKGLPR